MIELIAGATMSSPHANHPPLTPLEVCIGETLASALDLTLIGARPGEIFVHAALSACRSLHCTNGRKLIYYEIPPYVSFENVFRLRVSVGIPLLYQLLRIDVT